MHFLGECFFQFSLFHKKLASFKSDKGLYYYSIFFSAKKRYQSTEDRGSKNKHRKVRRINSHHSELEQDKEKAFALKCNVMTKTIIKIHKDKCLKDNCHTSNFSYLQL